MAKRTNKRTYYDYALVFIVIFLTVFGLVMIYSASSYTAQLKYRDPSYFMVKQAEIAAIGFALMIITSFIDYHVILKFAAPLYAFSIALLLFVTFAGKEINGRRRWIQIGSHTFQPSEVAKIALIILLAVVISNIGQEINTWKGLMRVFAWDLPLALIVAYNNLSAGIIIFGIAFVMTFIVTDKKWIYALSAGAAVLLLIFVEPISKAMRAIGLLKEYQLSRILVWLEPEAHPLDGGYQVLQGLYAIGSGGLVGKGLGESIQKLGFVPEAQNDMIFSIICEELGLFGAISLILIFLFMIYRFIVIANSAPDMYGSLICIGVMAHIAIQVILNIAVVSNVIPNTGITLPFISYGGTSVLMLMAEMGLVLSVSRQIGLET